MMRRPIALTLAATGLVAVGAVLVVVTTREDPAEQHWAAIETYCVDCHNGIDMAGGRAFDALSPDHIAHDADTWEAAIRKLRAGYMPPAGEPRPDRDSVAAIIRWLETEIDSAAAGDEPGRVALRRLNGREYENAIRDLLALNVDADTLLPRDNVAGYFDNNADALQVSPAFVDQYINAARTVAEAAIGDLDAPPVTTTYGDVANMVISLPPRGETGSGRQQHHVEGMPFGTRGGFLVEHNFPADGEYELTIGDMALAREVPRMEFRNTVIALLDGEEIYRTDIGGEADHKWIDQALDPAVEAINGRLRKIRFWTTSGQHELGVTFLHRSFAESDERTRTLALEGGQERIQAAHALQIRGPLNVTGLSGSRSRDRIFVCEPAADGSDHERCARDIVANLASRAFRRPVTDEDLSPLMAFYSEGHRQEGFERGVRDALSAILASPHFLYRAEGGGNATQTLSDVELASRLAFFLWSSLPDDELVEIATQGKLADAEVIAAQVGRMLADARARSLVENFVFQWLELEKLDEIVPDRGEFPHASGLLDQRELMKRELELFVDSVLRSDRSIVELLTARHTFLNERLAMHYGIETVKGARFREVELEDPRRHGLLGKGAVLSLTAYPNRTSPVLRGAWILERLLGAAPPEPPPEVESLPQNERGEPPKSLRARLEQHRENPTCYACHGIMDPLGFALENFNAVGQLRTHDPETLTPIDAAGELPDGTALDGPEDLQHALVARTDSFVQAFTENLLTFALGRSLDYRDMPAVRRIVDEARDADYTFEAIAGAIVASPMFRQRAPETELMAAVD